MPDFKIISKVGSESGRTYSGTSYNIEANTAGGILTFGPTDVWELKYPNFDIIGRSADQATAAAQGSAGSGGGY